MTTQPQSTCGETKDSISATLCNTLPSSLLDPHQGACPWSTSCTWTMEDFQRLFRHEPSASSRTVFADDKYPQAGSQRKAFSDDQIAPTRSQRVVIDDHQMRPTASSQMVFSDDHKPPRPSLPSIFTERSSSSGRASHTMYQPGSPPRSSHTLYETGNSPRSSNNLYETVGPGRSSNSKIYDTPPYRESEQTRAYGRPREGYARSYETDVESADRPTMTYNRGPRYEGDPRYSTPHLPRRSSLERIAAIPERSSESFLSNLHCRVSDLWSRMGQLRPEEGPRSDRRADDLYFDAREL